MVASCYSESLDFPCPLHQPLKGFGSLSVPVETCFEVSLGGRREGTAYTPGKTRTGAVFDCQKLNCMCLMNQVLHFWSWVPVEKVPLALCDSSIFRVLRNIASLRPGGPPGAGCALRVMALLMSPRQQTLSSWEKVLEIGGAKKKWHENTCWKFRDILGDYLSLGSTGISLQRKFPFFPEREIMIYV